jgi:hypothetical protein
VTRNQETSAPGPASESKASGAALIATFYGPRAEPSIHLLHERFFRSLSGVSTDEPVPERWSDPSGKVILRRFDPAAAYDTAVSQMAINATGAVTSAWESARQQLEELLEAPDTLSRSWGYTLVYQAVVGPDADTDRVAKELIRAVRRPGHPDATMTSLEQDRIPGGRMWLLNVPVDGDGLDTATVYVALGPSDEERTLVGTLYGTRAPFLMPDLVATKGYDQMRQYRAGNLQDRYVESVGEFRGATERLLSVLKGGAAETDVLEDLVDAYSRLIAMVARLEELRISMVKQSYNFDRWAAFFSDSAIMEHHRKELQTAELELELMVAEGRNALGTADTAMSMARVEIDREQARRQRRIGTLLAVVGVSLSVPGIMSHGAAGALIGWLCELTNTLCVPNTFLTQVATQVVFVAGIASLAALVINLISRRRGGRHALIRRGKRGRSTGGA